MDRFPLFLCCLFFLVAACSDAPVSERSGEELPAGRLFIIGGGKRPPAMIRYLVRLAGVDSSGYIAILPLASEEPDSAAWYAIHQFLPHGVDPQRIRTFSVQHETPSPAWRDSLRDARLIYLTGGDQNRFMEQARAADLIDLLQEAYRRGATVAGTSAGAAVMSRKMITGNEHKHPEYTGDFRTIEAENLEVAEGLGLLPGALVDQHFVYRMRMNRLITAALDHPDETCIGIDESTAILVQGDAIEVVGDGQVVVLTNPGKSRRIQDGLLGGIGLNLSVFLPGDRFTLDSRTLPVEQDGRRDQ